jgi:predicted HicB family RNase H-like nuclease
MGMPGSAEPERSAGANTLEYKGYIGVIEFDDDAGIFHGEVANLRDVITFQGECVSELRNAFVESIEDYLEFCAERGEDPEKPFSKNIDFGKPYLG